MSAAAPAVSGEASSPLQLILEHYTEPDQLVSPAGLPREQLASLALVLSERGLVLPDDYQGFLATTNGLTWNGIDMLGMEQGAHQNSGVDLLNARAVLDPGNVLDRRKLLIGADESYLYLHDPVDRNYQRCFRANFAPDRSYPDFLSLLTTALEERSMPCPLYRPAADKFGPN